MVIKRKDFQKAAAFIHEFLLKLSEDVECAEVRDTLNLALLHMQKYYRLIQNRSQEKCSNTLSLTTRGLSPMTPFVDAPDKFLWRWINLDTTRLPSNMALGDSLNFVVLPPLINAAKAGNVEHISDLLHQDPGCADCIDGLGRTGLMYAVHFLQHEALQFLLEHRADINSQAHDGSTAIHRACHNGNHVALKLLVDYGGDFTICDVQGRAPMHWAVTTRSLECLQILLANRAFPGARDKDGLTPSMWACRMDNIKHFELLCHAENNIIEEGDGIERDAVGRTWMHWSVRRTQPLECLQTLLTPDSSSIKDDEGKTVLLLAAEMGSLNACRLIVEIAGDRCIKDQDNQGRSALHLATMGGHGDVVNFLLERKADVNVVDSFNATAWDYARIRKLHYCQLIIMSHQRQRMSSNPNSPLPNGLGLLMREDGDVHDNFSRMSFRTRSNQSTPMTPPHPPKRPRSSRMLVRRSNSLTKADQDRSQEWNRQNQSQDWDRQRLDQERLPLGMGGSLDRKKERIMVNVSTPSKRMSTGDIFSNSREDTMMTTSSRPVFEDENDELSVGGMDVSDMEDEDETPQPSAPSSRGPSGQAHPIARPRPPPRARPPLMDTPPPQGHPHNGVNNYENSLGYPGNSSQQLQPDQLHRMDFEDAASGPSPRNVEPQTRPQPPQLRPQARVPPTPMYRPPKGVPIPSPPSSTPQRPHMLRQQQPLPPSSSRGGQLQQQQQQQQQREPTPPSVREVSPPLSSQSPDQQQHSSRTHSETEGLNPAGNQPPGGIEGRRIPPPALTPLQNAPKLPTMDSYDRIGKKKKKKKKDKDKRDVSSPQKLENPSDISPPRGFAAPLHPHAQGPGPQGNRATSAVPPPPRISKGVPQVSESRYVDENIDEDDSPPVVNGFAVQIRDGATKSARPGQRGGGGMVEQGDGGGIVEGSSMVVDSEQGEGLMQSPIEEVDEEDIGPLIPPPPSFRGATRGSSKPLAQSIPQDNKSSRMIPTSAKPPLPKSRPSVSSSSPRHSSRSQGKSATPGRKPRPPTSKSMGGM